jgi:hypothetical protein
VVQSVLWNRQLVLTCCANAAFTRTSYRCVNAAPVARHGELEGGSIMSRTFHHGERRTRVRGVRNNRPELRRYARVLIELAQAQAEADTEQQHDRVDKVTKLRPRPAGRKRDAA